ncbi:MAG: hypothetical protein JWM46_85 [Candidatus Kaiserbacteria bacterium]|nr:hypothetical protein [Candidatus Kaiserbacteria bacterium]
MDHVTVPKGEVLDCPEVIERVIAIAIAAAGRADPDPQCVEVVRGKLRVQPFDLLMVMFFKWNSGDRTPILIAIINDLFPPQRHAA